MKVSFVLCISPVWAWMVMFTNTSDGLLVCISLWVYSVALTAPLRLDSFRKRGWFCLTVQEAGRFKAWPRLGFWWGAHVASTQSRKQESQQVQAEEIKQLGGCFVPRHSQAWMQSCQSLVRWYESIHAGLLLWPLPTHHMEELSLGRSFGGHKPYWNCNVFRFGRHSGSSVMKWFLFVLSLDLELQKTVNWFVVNKCAVYKREFCQRYALPRTLHSETKYCLEI